MFGRNDRTQLAQLVVAGLVAFGLYTLAGEVISGWPHTLLGLVLGSLALYFPAFCEEHGFTLTTRARD